MRANAHTGIDRFNQQIIIDHAAQDWLRMSMDQVNLLVGVESVGRAAIFEALAYRVMPLLA